MNIETLNNLLVEAVIRDDYKATEILLEQGANPNGFIDDGLLTPLFFAVQHNALHSAFLLLAAGANPDYYCKAAATTPLALAAVYSHHAMLSLLLSSKEKAVH